MADKENFTKEILEKYRLYASAFFHGIAGVKILKAGGKIPGQGEKRIPADFLDSEIDYRQGFIGNQYRTCGNRGILNCLMKYRPTDAYATLMITMKDLYPGPNMEFCFGWASFTEGVAGFSFCRYDPAWDGIEDPDAERNNMMNGCAILCHEIGH